MGLLMRFRCVGIERHAVTLQPAAGPPFAEERQSIALAPLTAKSATHPNRAVWSGGIAAGELRLDELMPDLVSAEFRLHSDYVVEIRPADLEVTTKG